MSPRAALLAAVAAAIVLGGTAAWLLNVPLPAVLTVSVTVAGALVGLARRRARNRSARQVDGQ